MKEELKERLIKHISFLEEELQDSHLFRNLTWEIYRTDRSRRRNVERWIENLVNSSIDISRLIITAEGMRLPETYRDTVFSLSLVTGFDKNDVETLSQLVRLRNIVAHEYLDIRWASIERFIRQAEFLYARFLERVREYLREKLADGERSGMDQ